MKKIWLVLSILVFGLAGNLSLTEATMSLPSCAAPYGTEEEVWINALDLSRLLYFYNTGIQLEDEMLTSCEGTFVNNNGTTQTCLEPTCVHNYAAQNYPQFSELQLQEPYFANGRNCGASPCPPPPAPSFSSTILPFYRTVDTVNEGDQVRVFVYLHNNATQQLPGDPNYENYAAHNVEIALDWSNPEIFTVNVSSPDALNAPIGTIDFPGMTPANLSFSAEEVTVKKVLPVGYSQTYPAGSPEFVVSDTSGTIVLDTLYSSAANIALVYFDLEVVSVATPEMTLEKRAYDNNGNELVSGQDEMIPGESYTFSILAENTGSVLLQNVQATDPLDSQFTFTGGDSGVSYANGVVSINFGNIPIGSLVTKSFIVELSDTASGQVCNPLSGQTLIAIAADGTSATAVPLCFPVQSTTPPEYSILKQVFDTAGNLKIPGADELDPSATYTFRITATNTGTVTAENIVVTDELDPRFSFLSGDTGVTHNGGTVTVDFDPIAAGQTALKSFGVQLAQSATGSVCNPVSGELLTAVETASGVTASADPICFDVSEPGVSFSLEKRFYDENGNQLTPGSDQLEAGEDYTFTILITNNQSDPLAPNIIVTDPLDSDFTFEGGESGISYSNGMVTLTFGNQIPGNGTVSKSFDVSLAEDATGVVCNPLAGELLEAVHQPTGTEVTLPQQCFLISIPPEDYTIEKNAHDLQGNDLPNGATVEPGEQFFYDIVVTNTGDVAVTGLFLEDELDETLLFVSGGSGISYDTTTHTVSLTYPTIPVGGSHTKTFLVEVEDSTQNGTEICNTAEETTGGGGGGGATAQEQSLYQKIVWRFAQFLMAALSNPPGGPQAQNTICHYVDDGGGFVAYQVYKTAEDMDGNNLPNGAILQPMQEFFYNVRVVNTGTEPVENLILDDPLDSWLNFVSGDAGVSYDSGTHTVTLTYSTIPVNGEETLSFRVQVDGTTPNYTEICNTATTASVGGGGGGGATAGIFPMLQTSVSGAGGSGGGVQAANTICHTVIEDGGEPDLKVQKFIYPDTVPSGETVTFTIVVENEGDIPLTNVIATDELDPAFTYQGEGQYTQGDLTVSGQTVIIDFGDLALGESKVHQFVVEVNGEAGETICNQVSATAAEINWSETATACVTVTGGNYDLTLTKLIDPASLPSGEKATFSIVVENTGDLLLTEVIATDELDLAFTFQGEGPVMEGNLTVNGQIVTIDFDTLAPGESKMHEFSVQVEGDPGEEICNTVTATAAEIDWSELAEACLTITGGSGEYELNIEKTSSASSVPVGGMTTFSIVVENTGDNPLTEVIATDNLGDSFLLTGEGPIMEGELTLDNQIVTIDFGSLEPGQSKMHQFSVLVSGSAGETLCNLVSATTAEIDWAVMDEVCLTITGGGDPFDVEKTASDSGGAPLQDGDTVTPGENISYHITFENVSSTVFATDALDENLTFLDFSGNNLGTNQIIEWKVTSSETFTIDVLVNQDTPDGTIICNSVSAVSQLGGGVNQAVVTPPLCLEVEGGGPPPEPVCGNGIVEPGEECDDGNTNNGDGCSASCTEEGNGSPPVNPSIGFCDTNPNSSDWVCKQAYPDWDLDDPAYIAYKQCLEDLENTNEAKAICLAKWAEGVGYFPLCTPKDGFSLAAAGGTDWDDLWQEQCDPQIECPPDPCEYVNLSITKTVTPETVALHENPHYTVSLIATPVAPWTVTLKDIKIFDFSVPADSGWIWNRQLSDPYTRWEWNPHGEDATYGENFFWYNDIGGGVTLPATGKAFTVSYDMNTMLTVEDDFAENIKNVAFAVVELEAVKYDEGGTAVEEAASTSTIESCEEFLRVRDLFDSTEGDTAEVSIQRPYVEIGGGGSLGAQNLQTDYEKLTGTQGIFDEQQVGEEDLENLDDFTTSLDALVANLKENTTQTGDTFWGTEFKTIADESGVHFLESGNLTIDEDKNFDQAKTFFIETGDLIIDENVDLTGDIAAFIVREGNIYIDKDVSDIDGVFIAEQGKIFSAGVSHKQLLISGSLMGDARHLLRDRKYIGYTDDTGNFQLEPNIVITFDWRLIDATPPALESFLGQGWGQPEE
ncbi:MAG: DUF11 domain-containing protein [Candidatus Gracilibacteria bacterium]|nr:DUF11 domain-containing protein [Candidatus Gracilibacteria bacterium]